MSSFSTMNFRINSGLNNTIRQSPAGIRAGDFTIWQRTILRCGLFLLILTALLPAQNRRQFLIVEKPANLEWFDKYEQKLSFQQRREIVPYSPFLIRQQKTFLSDNFTPVMQVSHREQLYSILLDESGHLFQAERAGHVRIIKNAVLLDDTVEVLVKRTLFLSKRRSFKNLPGAGKYFLEPGERLRRIFRSGEFAYVEKLGTPRDFGWCFLAPGRKGRFWRIARLPKPPSAELPESALNKIRAELQEINQVAGDIFRELNQARGSARPLPQWSLIGAEDQWKVQISPPGYREHFPEAWQQLLLRIDNLLLRTSFQAEPANDGILITRRRQ